MSFDFDLGTGLSGAASGAAIGTQFGGPVGTAIGAGAGFLSGFLGDDDENDARQKAIERNRDRLRALTSNLESARERGPTETSFFQTGTTQLQEQAEEQAEEDASQAAARGLVGSQYEVAQDQNRAQSQAEGLRSLLRTAEEVDRREEARLFDAQQRQRETLNALLSGQAQAQSRQQRSQNQALQRVFQTVPYVLSQTDFGQNPSGAVDESEPFAPGRTSGSGSVFYG